MQSPERKPKLRIQKGTGDIGDLSPDEDMITPKVDDISSKIDSEAGKRGWRIVREAIFNMKLDANFLVKYQD